MAKTSGQYLTEYEKAQKRYGELVSGQGKFTELVKQKLGEKTNYNKDLIDQQNSLIEEQLALPSQLRSEFSTGPIRNPLQQEALIQGRQSSVGSSLGAVADLLTARGQRESDVLRTGAGVYSDRLTGAGTAAEAAWRLYQDRLAQEEAARNRAAQNNGPSIEDILKGLGVGETDGTGEPEYEIPTGGEFSNPETGEDDDITKLLKGYKDYQKSKGVLGRAGSVISNFGFGAINPANLIPLAMLKLAGVDLNKGSALTTKGKNSLKKFSKVYAEEQAKRKKKK